MKRIILVIFISVVLAFGSLLIRHERYAGTAIVERHGWPHYVWQDTIGSVLEDETPIHVKQFPPNAALYFVENGIFYAGVVYVLARVFPKKEDHEKTA